MKKPLIYLLLLIIHLGAMAQTKSYKRGVGYGYHSETDMQQFSSFLSWWYNWAAQPDVAIRNTYQNFGVDFTPMAWNAQGITAVNTWVTSDENIKYILGFNEPNFKDQANMTPTQAVAAWENLQNIAANNGLELVAPAVNYCGSCVQENGTTYTNPFTYLDDFFEACTGCQIDYLALHWYGGGASMPGYIDDARKYGKKIWVTEFAAWDNSVTNAAAQCQYLAGTVNFLERDPDIYRYAWFIGRTSAGINTYPYIDLYADDGELTPLGELYRDIPVYDSMQRFTVPGRIEVEEYYRMKGLFSEITSDTDGFLNIGWTDAGDWADYKITVQNSGMHTLKARVSGTSSGTINFLVDNQQLATLNTPSTGGWQSWRTVNVQLNLELGEHLLRMYVKKAGFNINWMELVEGEVSASEFKWLKASIFPNPVADRIIHVYLPTNEFGSIYRCSLTNELGQLVFADWVKATSTNLQINLNSSYPLPPGIYFLDVVGKICRAREKLIIK